MGCAADNPAAAQPSIPVTACIAILYSVVVYMPRFLFAICRAYRRNKDHICYRRPSTMMMWYPKLVLTSDERIGLSTVDGCSAKAASWNGPYHAD